MGLRAGMDWCGKSRPTGIRSPDRPARRQSLYRSANGNFLKRVYSNDVVWVFIVAYNMHRVHFVSHNEHIMFMLQRSNGLILFREIIDNYGDSHL